MDLRTFISIAALATGTVAATVPRAGGTWEPVPPQPATPSCTDRAPDCAPPRRALTVARAHDGLFRVPMTVNGIATSAILDTGAHDLILSDAQARRMGVRMLRGAGVRVRTAGGVHAMRWALADHIEVGGHRLRALRVGVLATDLPAPLLGLDAITRLRDVSIREGKLRIAPPAT